MTEYQKPELTATQVAPTELIASTIPIKTDENVDESETVKEQTWGTDF